MKKQFFLVIQTYLRGLTKIILASKKPQVIAITGSIAKSSTKEAVFAILKEKFGDKVAKSEGNLNTEIGAPLAILLCKRSFSPWEWIYLLPYLLFKSLILASSFYLYPKILVLEFAADKPKDVFYLTSFIKPEIGIVTAIGPSHLAKFISVEEIAKDKGRLIEVLPHSGYAILNEKDKRVREMSRRTKAKVIYFSPTGFDIAEKAAQKIAEIFYIKKEKAQKVLKNIEPLSGRMNIKRTKKGITILDDSYNSNPLSASYALDFLKNFSGKRKIAVLGDMLELGDYSTEGHKEIGKKARSCAKLVLTFGKEAEEIAKKAGGKHFQTKEKMVEFLLEELKAGDIVLIKASRGMKFEEIARKLGNI